MTGQQYPYQYLVLRAVPRVDREEFVNVAVVLYCQATDFLDVGWHLDEHRLRALDPGVDTAGVSSALAFVEAVCAGEASAGAAAEQPLGTRFGFLAAPRSTVVQPGPVHGGLTDDPAACLLGLVDRLVR